LAFVGDLRVGIGSQQGLLHLDEWKQIQGMEIKIRLTCMDVNMKVILFRGFEPGSIGVQWRAG
jgi:hypothetical protein